MSLLSLINQRTNSRSYSSFFKKNSWVYLFIYLWLCWVFVSVRGLSLVVASGGHSSSRCAGLSLSRPLLLRSTGCRRAGSVIVAHGPSCCAACGIFPDQGWNPCPLHWQADSQPLHHQGSPQVLFLRFYYPRTFSITIAYPSGFNQENRTPLSNMGIRDLILELGHHKCRQICSNEGWGGCSQRSQLLTTIDGGVIKNYCHF